MAIPPLSFKMKKPTQTETASQWADVNPPSGKFRKWSADGLDATQRQLERAGQYSRFVSIMKIALPLAAFAILLAVIVTSYMGQDTGNVSIFFTSTTGAPGELHMIKPIFTGFDSENRPYSLTAETATQDKQDDTLIHLETVAGELLPEISDDSDVTLDGPLITLSAIDGLFDSEEQLLTLTGSVTVAAEGDYLLKTQEAVFDFENDLISGDRPVSVEGATASITADHFEILDDTQTIVFRGKVKTYLKGQEEREAQENKTEPANGFTAPPGVDNIVTPVKKTIIEPSHEIIAEPIREGTVEPLSYNVTKPIKKKAIAQRRGEPASRIVAEPARDIVARLTSKIIVKPVRKPQSKTIMKITAPRRKPNQ